MPVGSYYGVTLSSPQLGTGVLTLTPSIAEPEIPEQLITLLAADVTFLPTVTSFAEPHIFAQAVSVLAPVTLQVPLTCCFVDYDIGQQTVTVDVPAITALPLKTAFADPTVYLQKIGLAAPSITALPLETAFADPIVPSQTITLAAPSVTSLPMDTAFADPAVNKQTVVTEVADTTVLPLQTAFVDFDVNRQAVSTLSEVKTQLTLTTAFADPHVPSQVVVAEVAGTTILPLTTAFCDSSTPSQSVISLPPTIIRLPLTTHTADANIPSQVVEIGTAADTVLPLTTAYADRNVPSQTVLAAASVKTVLPLAMVYADVDVNAQAVSESTATAHSAYFDGSAYGYRNVAGFLTAATEGTFVLGLKSTHLLGEDERMTFIAAGAGASPRIEMGIRADLGTVSIYIETDDGFITNRWDLEPDWEAINLFDGQWHRIAFSSSGTEYQVHIDGVPIADTDPVHNDGYWFKDLQDSGGNFTTVTLGAFKNGVTVEQYAVGAVDEPFITDRQLTDDEILELSVTQAKIDQLATSLPAVWADTQFAWRLTNQGGAGIGDEYITSTADYFTMVNTSAYAEGLRGILQLAADFNGATRLRVNDSTTFDHSGAVTVVAWVQFDNASPSSNHTVLAKLAVQTEWCLYRTSAGLMVFRVYDVGTVNAIGGSAYLDASKKYFVVGRSSPAQGGAQVIVGDSAGTALAYSSIATAGSIRLTASPIEFGAWNNSLFLDGGICDVYFFNQLLADADLDYLYNDGKGVSIAFLARDNPTLLAKIKAHWRLNETAGTRYDDIGSNHALVVSGETSPGVRTGHVID